MTEAAGLAGSGFDIGVAVGDYDNDGYPDIFVAGVYRNTLYHNNGDGTFTDVTAKAGLNHTNDPQYGPLWAITAAWVDVNNDGRLDLFVLNYLQWHYSDQPLCDFQGTADYCHPRFYKGQPNALFLNNGDGTFRDVSAEWGIRDHVGKGMGVGVADYDLDGRPDLFVTNDGYYNLLFHNLGDKFEEVAMTAGVALPEDGNFISGMGLDFRDVNNDGYPDIALVALNNQTFPLYLNTGKGSFREVTDESGMRGLTCIWQASARASSISTTMAGRICSSRAAMWIFAAAGSGREPAQHGLSQPGRRREMAGADRRGRARRDSGGAASRLRVWRSRRRRPRSTWWPRRWRGLLRSG